MFSKLEINVWVFMVTAMMAGVGSYHMLQITGCIGGIAPAVAESGVMGEYDRKGNRKQ